jgi:3',5'-cyclic AMP phosphodiesterase CpdA
MERREFLRRLTLSLAAGWACGRLSWPVSAWAGDSQVRLALLADAHLRSGNAGASEAVALARAVADIRALTPAPDLVLFAGDLAHKGRPDALDLGQEILADLPAPFWAVRGEGDYGRQGAAAWVRRFGSPRFSRSYGGCHLIGLDTVLSPTSRGPVFAIGADQRQWLAGELSRLDPATPLIVVSHAPLARLFHPWQQWTGDAPEVSRLLARFPKVLCLHGHVHRPGAFSEQRLRASHESPPPLVGEGWGEGDLSTPTLTLPPPGGGKNGVFQTPAAKMPSSGIRHYGLPATAWPRPQAVEGTPAVLRPGSGPRGCGWALLTLSSAKENFAPYLWQA